MDPLVSIIVPVYNVKPYLNRCVDSLLGQSYQNMELLLVDGRSSDGTRQVMERYRQEHRGEYRRVLLLDNPGKTLPCG